MNNEFGWGHTITHKNGSRYVVVKTPDHRRLEYCNEPFYEYESITDGQVWIRCQSEMEDGRFTSN